MTYQIMLLLKQIKCGCVYLLYKLHVADKNPVIKTALLIIVSPVAEYTNHCTLVKAIVSIVTCLLDEYRCVPQKSGYMET
jgi:hypothetical protein